MAESQPGNLCQLLKFTLGQDVPYQQDSSRVSELWEVQIQRPSGTVRQQSGT